jgi:regulator of sigma E protease
LSFLSTLGTVGSVIISLLILNVFIMIHELGHYIAGKKLGFGIPEFSIGMGPKAVSWQRGETTFYIRWLPIGGYCKFQDEDESDKSADPKSMYNRPVWARMIMTASGSIMNIISAIVICIGVLTIYGEYQVIDQAYVASVEQNSPAQMAGLQENDRIVSLGGRQVTTVQSALDSIVGSKEEPTPIIVERDGRQVELSVTPKYDEETARYRIGITLNGKVERHRLNFFESIVKGFQNVWEMIVSVFVFFGQLIGGLFAKIFNPSVTIPGTGDVVSIVGVVGMMSTAVRQDFEVLLWLAAVISVNLGVVNLLPIPALDGSRLVFQFYELITKRRVPPEREGVIHLVGFFMMLILFVILGVRDVSRMIGG